MIDTHTHIYGEEFDEDRSAVVARALEAGVNMLLLPNIAADSWQPMLDLCAAHPGVCFPMLGLHPTDLPDNPAELLDRMIALAFKRQRQRDALTFSFETNLLAGAAAGLTTGKK